jgi:hypothetical protein
MLSLHDIHADDDETALPDDIAVCEEEDDSDDAAAADDDGDVDMFGGEDGEDEQQQRQARQKQWGGRKVPKNINAAIAAAMEGNGGFAVTKFNMNAEREEGNIDEEVRSAVASKCKNTLLVFNHYLVGACREIHTLEHSYWRHVA